ncbi:ABC transporter ATP-binding protein [Lysinibacillus sp. 54212]|uniref:ABC transporter ATP-binding protein n=1 Tax=Lysinibacillus sp. 54212 TaxID=3119829 RepID=UPI002FC9F4A6
MTLFTMENVEKSFNVGEISEHVLKGVNLSVKEGEVTALVGASGSGKSTLLTIAACLQQATDGNIIFNGQNLNLMKQEQIRQVRAREFGFIFQFSHLVPFLNCEDQLKLMLDVAEIKMSKKEQQEEIHRMLELVGMAHRKKAFPASLSGGEKQRIAIARALIHKPKVLFADEPTASLDSKRSRDIMELIRHLTLTLNVTTLIVTHDEEMLSFADRIIKMSDGIIVQDNSNF